MKSKMWDDRYLSLAQQVSTWSKDPSTKVGCVIIDDYGRPVSFGYNGFAKGVDDSESRLLDRPTKLRYTIHAENNAILSASKQQTVVQYTSQQHLYSLFITDEAVPNITNCL